MAGYKQIIKTLNTLGARIAFSGNGHKICVSVDDGILLISSDSLTRAYECYLEEIKKPIYKRWAKKKKDKPNNQINVSS